MHKLLKSLVTKGHNHSYMMEQAQNKLNQRNSILAKHKSILYSSLAKLQLTDITKQSILNSSVRDLSRRLRSGEITSESILLSYFE
jgi:hypothetical protein